MKITKIIISVIVVLSVIICCVFPMGAIYIGTETMQPGEYDENHIVRYDVINKTYEYIEVGNYDSSQGTYAYLNEADRQRMNAINESYNVVDTYADATTFSQSSTTGWTSELVQIPSVSVGGLYSGVVFLKVIGRDSNGATRIFYGTGFVVDSRTVVTAFHVTFPDDENGFFWDDMYIYEYVHGSSDTVNLDTLPYTQVQYTVCDDRAFDDDMYYDWCVLTPRYELSVSYYFDCYSVGESTSNPDVVYTDLADQNVFSIGYPAGYEHYMMRSSGRGILANMITNTLTMSNRITYGMSGGPVYITYYGPRVVAINSRFDNSLYTSWGSLITPSVYNAICQNIQDY